MNLKNITPTNFKCLAGTCPAVYADDLEDKIVIVGKTVDPEKADLVGKVGDDENAVVVEKAILDEIN